MVGITYMSRTTKFRKRRIKARFYIFLTVLILIIASTIFYFNYDKLIKKNNDITDDNTTIDTETNIETGTNSNDNNDNTEENEDTITENETDITKTVVPERNPIADQDYLPEKLNLNWDIIKDNKVIKDFNRGYNISMPDSSEYSSLPGITCFRGNNYRNAPSYGYADIKEEKLVKLWSFSNGSIDTWTGVGWTGQPAIVMWDEKTRNIMNINPNKKEKENLKEVIYATLDGKIYFFDLEDGKPTRDPINIGYSTKGTVTIDPRGYPLLYTGQGIPDKNGKRGPIGYRIFSLIDQKQLSFIDGMDKYAFRSWGAFDCSGVIDPITDTLIEGGENGILYTAKLNTKYSPENKTISIDPEYIRYRYKSSISKRLGIENSPVVFKNFAYFIDNSGLLQCLDLNTLTPIWARNVTDDTDSTPVFEVENEDEAFLYTANEVDLQGHGGISYIRKIDAFSGKLVWEKPVKCTYNNNNNGGALASPVMGKHDIKDLVIYNIAKTGKTSTSGRMYALDKKTGNEIWTVDFDNYCWSSPVDVYTREGKSYIVVCDSVGNMFLIEGINGKILDTISLGSNIEASPAIYDNTIVIGTRGQQIFGIRIT